LKYSSRFISVEKILKQRIFLAYASMQRVMKSNQMTEESPKIERVMVMPGEGRGWLT